MPDPDRNLTARLELSQLEPGRRYAYEVSQAGRVVADEFVTAPAPSADAPVHLAWSGDLGGADFVATTTSPAATPRRRRAAALGDCGNVRGRSKRARY